MVTGVATKLQSSQTLLMAFIQSTPAMNGVVQYSFISQCRNNAADSDCKKFAYEINMMRKKRILLLAFAFTSTLVLMTSCIFSSGYPSGPIKWSMVSGDGSWNSSSRKWTVSFAPGETKTATIQLDNTGSQNLWVLLVPEGPPDYIVFNLQGTSSNVVEVLAGGSTEFTISGTASLIAPQGNHNYVVHFNWSTNQSSPP